MNVVRCTRQLTMLYRATQLVVKRAGLSTTNNLVRPLYNAALLSHSLTAPISFKPLQPCRAYSHMEMNRHLITERIMMILRLYDKINPEKLTLESQFAKDLGLDSLDHVELIMAVEEEFSFEIPDQDSERLRCPKDIVQYICDKLDVFE